MEPLAQLISQENGKTIAEARASIARVKDLEPRRMGGHGGADALQDLIFRGPQGPDPLGLRPIYAPGFFRA